MNLEIEEKLSRLNSILLPMGNIFVAFSGGVDSTFLLRAAVNILGDNVAAVTAKSASFPERELQFSREMAADFKTEHIIIESFEMDNDKFRRNDSRRCYWCKQELFRQIKKIAGDKGCPCVVEASNWDDISDYRPGLEAVRELGVRSPLIEAKLGKDDIRVISREWGIKTWDKPSFACLASRIPYGLEVTARILNKISRAEDILIAAGFTQVRVRHHDDIARIEVFKDDFCKILRDGIREVIVTGLKEVGYRYVVFDLEGYRSGSMNPPEAAVSG